MLLDHFHPPLKNSRPWTGFHSMWATKLAVAIGGRLPEGWFAAPTVHWDIEVDVATFEHTAARTVATHRERQIVIPEPTKTIEFAFLTDVVEVQVYRDIGELTLVGVVEIISPANKDRSESREAFVSKCDSLLRDAIGLVIVDIVTSRHANLHADLMERFGGPKDDDDSIYISAYRPFPSRTGPALSIWYHAVEVGKSLPSVLLFLKEGPVVELPLAETYDEACRDLKIRP